MSARAGADIVKFQMHLPEFESTIDEPFRENTFLQDKSRWDYWKRIEFSLDEWILLKKHCDAKQIEFMCTPFSLEAAKLLWENNLISRWKIGSGEISNLPLLDYAFKTGAEVLLSTGLTTQNELDNLVKFISSKYGVDSLTIMHCVSQYPVELENTSLYLVNFFKDRYQCKVGYSDHSGNVSTALKALTLPISYLEVHLTPNENFFGPDVSSSLTYDKLEILTKFKRDLIIIDNSAYTRDELFKKSASTAKIFRKGLYWAKNYSMNTIVSSEHIILRKPEQNLSGFELNTVVGKKLKKDVMLGAPVTYEDFF
jgi:N-acetylneuraminate synthase